jgi:hypothetical protein
MTDTTVQSDADQLKGRRGNRGKTVPRNTALSQAPDPPEAPTVSAAIARSSSKVLFAPGEHPAVVQNGGFVPPAVLDDLYVVATEDASESFVPRNARTPISKMLWTKGALVRKDIFELYAGKSETEPEDSGKQEDPQE